MSGGVEGGRAGEGDRTRLERCFAKLKVGEWRQGRGQERGSVGKAVGLQGDRTRLGRFIAKLMSGEWQGRGWFQRGSGVGWGGWVREG